MHGNAALAPEYGKEKIIMNAARLTVRRTEVPSSAATTPELLPDVSTPEATRDNAMLVYIAAREAVLAGPEPRPHARNGRPGVIGVVSLAAVVHSIWGAYDRTAADSASTNARTALSRYLADTGNLVLLQNKGRSGGLYWIADEWDNALPDASDAALRTAPEYPCKVPGCGRDRFGYHSLRVHLQSAHQLRYPAYRQMVAGARPWPAAVPVPAPPMRHTESTGATEEHPVPATVPAKPEDPAPGTHDPADCLTALIAEVRALRQENTALRSGSGGITEELETLRRHNTELRAKLEELRQFKNAVNAAMGRKPR